MSARHHSALLNWAGALALVLIFVLGQVADQFDAWRARLRARAELLQSQLQHQQTDANYTRAMRDYEAWVHRHCGGTETWWRPTRQGALACTDKHGRSTGQVLVGAQP